MNQYQLSLCYTDIVLYKINELVFNAIVLYPFKVYNFESGNYEYKKNSFMRFIPHERNKNYKIFDETGFYRSTVKNIPEYFGEFDRMQVDPSVSDRDKDLMIFAMYFDFMSYVAQRLGCYHDRGITLDQGRESPIKVIMECNQRFSRSLDEVSNGMCAMVKESYPEPRYIKDENLDYQALKSVTWSGYTGRKNTLTVVKLKEILVDKMATNVSNQYADHLR